MARDDDDDRDHQRRRHRFRCPYCDSSARPVVQSKISVGGWIVFAVLLLVFFPLCWLGLLMTETHHECYDCGIKIGG